ncbi:unnamed protein product, partial [Adineta steineri]
EYRELQSVEVSNDSSVGDCENELSEYDSRIETLKEQKSKKNGRRAIHGLRKIQQHVEAVTKQSHIFCHIVNKQEKLIHITSYEDEVHKDTRSLPGGERSFSTVYFMLALWKVVLMNLTFLCGKGEGVYTFKKVDPLRNPTQSAYPG